MQRVNVIGAGKVGRTIMALTRAAAGYSLGDVASRNGRSARAAVAAMSTGRAVAGLSDLHPAELWFLTVPDDAIADVAQALTNGPGLAFGDAKGPRPVAVHCSGFLSSQALAPLQDLGWLTASCHPVSSFADPELAARQFPGTLCGIEGEADAVDRVEAFVTTLGGRPFAVNADRKALYHAGAVFSNNFAVVLQAIAMETWAAAGVSEEIAGELCASLLGGTAANVAQLGPAAALTGPAARGDRNVLETEEKLLAGWHPEAAVLYRDLSRLARALKRTGSAFAQAGADPEPAREPGY